MSSPPTSPLVYTPYQPRSLSRRTASNTSSIHGINGLLSTSPTAPAFSFPAPNTSSPAHTEAFTPALFVRPASALSSHTPSLDLFTPPLAHSNASSHPHSHSHSHPVSATATPPNLASLSRRPSDLSHLAFQPPTSPPSSGTPLESEREKKRTPYHPRFQPKGVRRERWEDFLAVREKEAGRRRLDDQRVERRAQKLIALHFPASTPTPLKRTSTNSSLSSISSSISRSSSDVWSKTLKNLTLGRGGEGGEWEIRNAEQAIVKWEDDASVSRCPICMAAFGLKTRKHHCRLCGRIVCFLPPNASPLSKQNPPPSVVDEKDKEGETAQPIHVITRTVRCSTFITYELNDFGDGSGRIVEIDVDEEARERDKLNMNGKTKVEPAKEEKRKEIRVCRDCVQSVLRRQTMTLNAPIPNYVKLHKVLIQVEEEVEALIPDLQELVINMNSVSTSNPNSTALLNIQAQALTVRKKILSSLTSYDTLSRRIRDLPLQKSEGQKPGGSQQRLTKAISTRAALWLGEKMAALRGLGALDSSFAGGDKTITSKRKRPGNRTASSSFSTNGSDDGKDVRDKIKSPDPQNGALAILMEQEQLVAGYLEEANKRRQFEDAAALQTSLDELRAEIAKLRAAS
ncbi:hypothetical protein BT69DRAFT_1072118 [Atractiella rhizophila]|nr:hypothetical protein BT69DRAFT_1072118 [Atractiella rhizophila]